MTQKCTTVALLIAGAIAGTLAGAQEAIVPDAAMLLRMAARFAPTEIGADLSKLSVADRRVIGKLVEASKIIDALFLRQVWSGNEAMLLDLARNDSPDGRARLHYFLLNKGPWSRLDHNQPFIPGAPPKPAGSQLLSRRRDESRSRALDTVAVRAGAGARHRILHDDPARGRRLRQGALHYRVPDRACTCGVAAARGCTVGHRTDAQELPHEARRRVSLERLLR